jgi:septal ring factor EnvC (AmiA/AmiB activator)
VSRTRQRRGTLARAQTAWLLGAALLGAALPSSASREQDLTVVRRAIEDSRERVASYEREQRGVLEALEAIERSAQILEREVALVTRDAAQARKEHASLEAEAAEHARKLEATRRALSKRAVALYPPKNGHRPRFDARPGPLEHPRCGASSGGHGLA